MWVCHACETAHRDEVVRCEVCDTARPSTAMMVSGDDPAPAKLAPRKRHTATARDELWHAYDDKGICVTCGVSQTAATRFGWGCTASPRSSEARKTGEAERPPESPAPPLKALPFHERLVPTLVAEAGVVVALRLLWHGVGAFYAYLQSGQALHVSPLLALGVNLVQLALYVALYLGACLATGILLGYGAVIVVGFFQPSETYKSPVAIAGAWLASLGRLCARR